MGGEEDITEVVIGHAARNARGRVRARCLKPGRQLSGGLEPHDIPGQVDHAWHCGAASGTSRPQRQLPTRASCTRAHGSPRSMQLYRTPSQWENPLDITIALGAAVWARQ
ncbi:hypothetical protein GCM10017781_32480 [Deinococcus metalli]|uniref:Uncharacterized protein n=1 Tax=Deinococcus metalli TaxID=1141878 RepID=A0ABQ3JQD9_9DEIO|nr:hypothetical protein GCM10017781_32480 [Deinococcus metalli]